MSPVHHTLPRSLWLLLIALTLCWGFNWPMMKLALAELPVWSFRAACIGGGAAGLFAIARLQRLPIRLRQGQFTRLAVASLFNVTAWNVLIGYGVSLMPSGRSAILAYTMPLWTVVLAIFFLHERLTLRKATGIALGMGGLGLLLGSELMILGSAPAGALLILAAALSWATGTIIIRRWPVDLPTTSFVGWQLLLGGIPVLLGAIILEQGRLQPISPVATGALLYSMLIAFVFCHWAWFKLATTAPAGIAAMSTMMIPVVGVFSGMVVLQEQPRWQEYAALALVTLALATVLIPGRAIVRKAKSVTGPGQSGHSG